ncbi:MULTISPECIES: hypothetical protein [Blautia]|uniref:hypothetical protein n=1 Tax=Blautia TaxID=572511 RepID=UPI000BA3E136|nr:MULTISPECIES: hypothetical protein [Blautia]
MNREDNININVSAPNLISVCVDTSDHGEFSGRLYQCYEEEPWRYKNVVQLLRLMDNLYDIISYPQASTESRSFVKKEKEPSQRLEKRVPQDEILKQNGQVATFVIYVQYRQNATWQGEVIWKEKGMKQHFSSALELIKLVDSALGEYDI